MKPDFDSTTNKELRAYVIANPKDLTAFHLFVDRFTKTAPTETYDIPKSITEVKTVEALIKRKLEQLK